jgi:hypothetical protein
VQARSRDAVEVALDWRAPADSHVGEVSAHCTDSPRSCNVSPGETLLHERELGLRIDVVLRALGVGAFGTPLEAGRN